MKKDRGYKIAVWILSCLVIIEGVFIIMLARPKKIPKLPLAIKGKIAIVLDDWGYNLNNLAILEQIKYPLTLSVLPRLDYSKVIADELHKRRLEIILHLPLEPYEKVRLENNTIMVSMDEPAIKNILAGDLKNIPYVRGVSNHMGSKATEDLRIMKILFREFKKRNLYFLDSLVSAETVGFDLAHKMGLAFGKRDIFLDNKKEAQYIKGQINKIKIIAKVYGQAIGIGHDQKVTLEVLKEAMPEIEKEGYKFVFVSELVK